MGKRRKVSDLPAKSEGRGVGPEQAPFRNNGISTRVTARNCDALIVPQGYLINPTLRRRFGRHGVIVLNYVEAFVVAELRIKSLYSGGRQENTNTVKEDRRMVEVSCS